MERLACLLLLVGAVSAQDQLGSYLVNGYSTSGFSTGASFAQQFHIAYSGTVQGVGVVAGIPYYCNNGNDSWVQSCNAGENTDDLGIQSSIIGFSNSNNIDDYNGIRNARVFLLHGPNDPLSSPANQETIQRLYTRFMQPSQVKVENTLDFTHGWPQEYNGADCTELDQNTYINKCDYDTPLEMFKHILDDITLEKATNETVLAGDWIQYDQTEFGTGNSLDTTGWAYVPLNCRTRNEFCHLHVHFHGCHQGQSYLGETYAQSTMLNHFGEENNVIILYPQVRASFTNPVNPDGCWDIWGYTNAGIFATATYVQRGGPQMAAVKDAMDRVAGNNPPTVKIAAPVA